MSNINSHLLKEMFLNGAENLINNKAYVDKLNVFPVPDGDTGTNMSLTIKSAVEELNSSSCDDLRQVGLAITRGSLMGARGNSGVILSQILRGFGKSIEGKEELDCKEIALALKSAKEVAYSAVIRPVEGTILTVIREISEFATENYEEYSDVVEFFKDIVDQSKISLEGTPNLLKELKQAGVVDSGGQGLVFILEGMYKKLIGEELVIVKEEKKEVASGEKMFAEEDIHILDEEPEFGYCTEFMVKEATTTPDEFRKEIEGLGNSLIVVGADDIIKIHIHTNHPGKAMELGNKYGQLTRIKVENMRLQFRERIKENKEGKAKKIKSKINKGFGIVAVSMGEGLDRILEDFGVDCIIQGGQTMNPSTNDFLAAINEMEDEKIFIFPNNSNIIMAANQAKELSKKEIEVIPSKNIPQCFQALINMNLMTDFERNKELFIDSLDEVKTGQVTFAVRDTVVDDITIKKDDFIGITGKEIVASGKELNTVTENLIEKLVDEDSEMMTLFYGQDVKQEDADEFLEVLEEKFPDLEIDIHYGGQPLYYYILSVE